MIRNPTELLVVLLIAVTAPRVEAAAPVECIGDGRNVWAEVRSRGTLRVAHTNDYRPFSARSDDGTPMGIDVDLARRLGAELGVRIEWVDTTWSTLLADLQANRYDVAMSGVSVTPERAAAGCFTATYFITGKTALARCALQRRFDTLAQLDTPATTVIVNRGGTNERFVRERLPHARIVVHDDNRTVFTALAAGAADVMITDAVEARLQAHENPALCVAEPPPLFETVEKAYLLPKDPAWQARLDAWLAALRADGELETIVARQLEPATPQ